MLPADRLVQVESGQLRGAHSADGAVLVFKGIPYAKPPVGNLRWRAPQPPDGWNGVRSAEAFGPRCVQPDRRSNSVSYYGPEAESEDCLTLNIWTKAPMASPQPVMVWFHGGAFYVGSASLPLFNGEHLAKKGVVVVTVNYRLGRLGFLAHPELTQESGFSGNYGLLDQIAALRWVRDNIAAFGGDPNRVTIFGQSAGSISGSVLMATPLAKGLFSRVIGQSGGLLGPVAESCNTGDSIQTLAAAEAMGVEFASALGANSLAELRALPAQDIQLAHRRGGTGAGAKSDPSNSERGVFDTNWPILDGHVLPESPYAIFASGRQNDVPLMTGNVANEGATMPSVATVKAFIDQSRADHGDNAGALLQLYPARTDDEARIASRTAFASRNFYWQNWTWAHLQARTGTSPVYFYQFSHVPPIPPDAQYAEAPGKELEAFHCAEIPYIYRNLEVWNWRWQDVDRHLSDTVSSYWVNFATAGDPNGAGLPKWPTFDPKRQMMMEFSDDAAAAQVPHLPRLEFWDAYYTAQRARERSITA